ncbi:MAG: hypothetical protein HRT63_11280 [Erythrobacter sp.]|nr:hypothetical protein [Erythrobacter sp.]
MSKDSKQTTNSNNLQLPKAPDYITDSVEGLTGAIMNLGQRDPNSYVSPQSPLQSQAFGMGSNIASRYGATPMPQFAQPSADAINIGRNQSAGGQGLFDSLGVRQPETVNYDYNAIAGARPDIQAAYNTLTPQQHSDIARVTGNPDGRVSLADFARFQIEENAPNRTPADEARLRQLSGFSDKPTDPRTSTRQSQPGRDIMLGADNRVQMGSPAPQAAAQSAPQAAQSPTGFNPLALYGQAADATRAAGMAGPNTIANAALYSPEMSDAANIGEMASYSPQMLEAQAAYDAALNAANNFSGGRVQAQSLLDGLQNYMSPYTSDVVDTTLAGFDVDAERTRAARAAAAAGSGASRGTRNSIFEAVLEGELARERAGTEAGLRDQAFNTGAGLSASDANLRQSASVANAQLAQQAAEARQRAELQRANMMFQGALTDQSYQNQAGQFNAANQNNRTLAQAGYDQQANLANQAAANTGSQFNASTLNDLNRFNASQADIALNRTLQGAGQLANIGSTYQGNERADLGLLSDLGAQQRQIDGQQRTADLNLLQTILGMAGGLGLNTSQVTGISNQGTQTSSVTPGLLDYVNGFANLASGAGSLASGLRPPPAPTPPVTGQGGT